MTFDLNNTPPTQAAIDQEREHLTRVLAKQKRQVWMVSGATIVLSALVSYWCHLLGLLTEKQVAITVLGTVAVAGAFLAAFSAVGGVAILGAGALAVISTGAGVALGTGAGAGAVLGAGASVIAVAFTAIRLDEHFKKMERSIQQLTALETPENKHRCEDVLAACGKDTLCRDYAAAVARQERSLVLAEADLITDWVADATACVTREEKDRLQQVACNKLKHMHELHGEE